MEFFQVDQDGLPAQRQEKFIDIDGSTAGRIKSQFEIFKNANVIVTRRIDRTTKEQIVQYNMHALLWRKHYSLSRQIEQNRELTQAEKQEQKKVLQKQYSLIKDIVYP